MGDETGEAPGSKVLCWITSMSPNPFRRRCAFSAARIRSGRWPGHQPEVELHRGVRRVDRLAARPRVAGHDAVDVAGRVVAVGDQPAEPRLAAEHLRDAVRLLPRARVEGVLPEEAERLLRGAGHPVVEARDQDAPPASRGSRGARRGGARRDWASDAASELCWSTAAVRTRSST